MKNKYLFSLALFILSFLVKLPYLFPQTAIPDEIHWLERSQTLLENFENKDFSHLTSHLGHPGIPAAYIMAAAEKIAEKWNKHFDFKERGSNLYIDELSAARLGIAFFSSLIIPLVFLFTLRYFNLPVALLSSLLLTFDCQLIGLSRIAHIDSILTLLTLATVICFVLAEEKNSLILKLFSGILWGLSLATKPTAIFTLAALGLYKLLRYFSQKKSKPEFKFYVWSDIWGVVLGQITLCLVFTKLWHENNNYVRVLHINPTFLAYIYQYADLFQSNYIFNLLLPSCLLILAYCCIRMQQKNSLNLFYHLAMLAILSIFLLLALTYFPTVAANTVRFWYRVKGFSHIKHEAYSVVYQVPGYGYPEIWLRRLPELIILSYGLCLFSLFSSFRKKETKDSNKTVLLLTVLALPIIWTIALNISSKQTIRYVLPCFPFIYMASGYGLWNILSTLRKESAYVLSFSFILLQAAIYTHWSPYQSTYYNFLSGGTKAALDRGWRLTPAYLESSIEKLNSYATKKDKKQNVEVLGDLDMVNFNFNRQLPANQRFINFSTFISGISSDWVLYFTYFAKHSDEDISKHYPHLKPAFSYFVDDIPIYTLYKIGTPNYVEPVEITSVDIKRDTGELYKYQNIGQRIVAEPESSKAGYLMKNFHPKISPGNYLIKFNIARFEGDPPLEMDKNLNEKFVDLEFSKSCKKTILTKEVTTSLLVPIELNCQIIKDNEAEIQIYWHANAAIRMGSIIIQKVEP